MNDLFFLINSLTPNEKRYFKVYSQRTLSNKANIYKQLFEALDGLEKEDEAELLKKYRKAKFIKHLAAHKSYLYNIILKCLREYNEENIMEWQIRESYFKIKLLASKGLDKQCLKLIEKSKILAWQYEVYTCLEDILEVQLYLFGNCRIGNFNTSFLQELIDEKEKLLSKINDYKYVLNNWHLINILFQNIDKYNAFEVQEKAKQIIEHANMQKERTVNDGLLIRLRYLACFELYYNGIGDVANCYEYNKLLVQHRKIIEQCQPLTTSDSMAVWFNFMIACFKYEKWQEMEETLVTLTKFETKTPEQKIRQFHNNLYCGLLLYLSTKNLEKANNLVENYKTNKEKFAQSLRLDFKIVIESLCGLACYFSNKMDDALEWWNGIANMPKHSTELRTQGAVRIYRILYYLKLNELSLVESEMRNTQRFLKKNNLYNLQEAQLLKIAKTYLFKQDKKDIEQEIDLLKTLKRPLLTEHSVYNQFMFEMLKNLYK